MPTDRQLMRQIRAHAGAFDQLYLRHCEPVRRRIVAMVRDSSAADELFARAGNARKALGQVAIDVVRSSQQLHELKQSKGFGVLARAMKAERPAAVFARAAAIGQADPLTDLDSRLFVGARPIASDA